jgi:AcrR family transcriptional regulator
MVVNETKTQGPRKRSGQKTRGETTRAEILEAGLEVLARRGFEAFTVAELADDLGLSEGAIYYHFESRDVLLLEMALIEMSEHIERENACLRDAPGGAEALVALVRTNADAPPESLHIIVQLLNVDAAGQSRKLLERCFDLVRPQFDMLEALLDKDRQYARLPADVRPRLRANTVSSQIDGVSAFTQRARDFGWDLRWPLEELVDDICTSIFVGTRLGHVDDSVREQDP